jgi:hypothetical protein
MIDMSHAELRGLIVKAVRGAGLDWGLAEEAGWAAEWLSRRSLPAAEWAVPWLEDVLAGGPDPIALGVQLSDLAVSGKPAEMPLPDELPAPGYLLPFLHLAASRLGRFEVAAGSGRTIRAGADGEITFGPDWPEAIPNPIPVGSLGRETGARRAKLSAQTLARLEAFSLRTTVPPSDASRQNAGSTLSDND